MYLMPGALGRSNDEIMPLAKQFTDHVAQNLSFLPFLELVDPNAIVGGDPSSGVRIDQIDLKPLDMAECSKYIFHRLKTAGMNKDIFTKEAIENIYEESQGIPRKINNICDLSLLVGYTLNLKVIDSKTINKVIADSK